VPSLPDLPCCRFLPVSRRHSVDEKSF